MVRRSVTVAQRTHADTDFTAAMAAAQTTAHRPCSYENAVKRAPMAEPSRPATALPGRESCRDCPHVRHRLPADLTPADTSPFVDLIVAAGEDLELTYVAEGPPKILAGIDLAEGPHERVMPGFEDYARVSDATVLADALYFNRVLPECACTRALFDAADDGTVPGLWLDFLRQEAGIKASGSRRPKVTRRDT